MGVPNDDGLYDVYLRIFAVVRSGGTVGYGDFLTDDSGHPVARWAGAVAFAAHDGKASNTAPMPLDRFKENLTKFYGK